MEKRIISLESGLLNLMRGAIYLPKLIGIVGSYDEKYLYVNLICGRGFFLTEEINQYSKDYIMKCTGTYDFDGKHIRMVVDEIIEKPLDKDFKNNPISEECEFFKDLLSNDSIVIYDHNGELQKLKTKINKISPIDETISPDDRDNEKVRGLVKTITPPRRRK